MKASPSLSVIMSVYNTPEDYLMQAIESVITQSYADFEFIIVDDCSDNDVLVTINSFKDDRIIFLRNEINRGLAYSLNRCLQIAKGKYIARMDSDDICYSKRFEKQIKYFETNNIDILSTQVQYFGRLRGKTCEKWTSEKIKANLIFENKPIVHPTVMIRKSFLKEHNLMYNEDYKKSQDYELWFRSFKYAKFGVLDEVLLLYRIHANQASSGGKSEQNNYADNIRINLIKSLYTDIDIDEESHKELCYLNASKDIHKLVKWCDFLIKLNRENKVLHEKYMKDIVITRLLIVYLKTIKQKRDKFLYLVSMILCEKLLLNIFIPKYFIKLLAKVL